MYEYCQEVEYRPCETCGKSICIGAVNNNAIPVFEYLEDAEAVSYYDVYGDIYNERNVGWVHLTRECLVGKDIKITIPFRGLFKGDIVGILYDD